MSVEIQKVIFYNKSGDIESKKIILQKIINKYLGFIYNKLQGSVLQKFSFTDYNTV